MQLFNSNLIYPILNFLFCGLFESNFDQFNTYYISELEVGPGFTGQVRAGFGPEVDKIFGLNSGLRRTSCIRCTKM